jgi:hypothetical protein
MQQTRGLYRHVWNARTIKTNSISGNDITILRMEQFWYITWLKFILLMCWMNVSYRFLFHNTDLYEKAFELAKTMIFQNKMLK